jgi:tyrosyl-tRNA synthetase
MKKTDTNITPEIKKEALRQHDILSAGTIQIVPEGGLLKKLEKSLANKKPLKVKLGVDPTAPDIHLGHTVVLQKLKQFQELGHTAMLLIGDFTASIGDPSGRNKTRPPLSSEEIQHNAETYMKQAFKVLDKEKTSLLKNSTWCADLSFADIIKLLSSVTVSQILQREDFHNRYTENQPIAMHELLYPIMQGYDSVAMEADVELGGTDQTFNCLMGRELQKDAGQPLQIVVTLPLLEGTDGEKKMSKSLGNYIGLTDEPNDMFGKVMSIPDTLLLKYFALLTDVCIECEGDIPLHPMEAKKELAKELVTRFHSKKDALAAQEDFETRFSANAIPEELPEHTVTVENGGIGIAALMVEVGFTQSNGEGIRLVKQNAVKINGEPISDPKQLITPTEPFVLQAGKRKMARVTLEH